jgi:AraC-like DNA-binding protein
MTFVFEEERPSALPVVDMFWHTTSTASGSFISPATSNWELVVTTLDGKTCMTARGPETYATEGTFPADATFFGISFKLGTFMPHLPLKHLLNRQDFTLPAASTQSFWLQGAAWEVPTFENADVFVKRLIHDGILIRDPLVEDTIQGHYPALSVRSLQYRFLHATGISHKTIQQIERAKQAAALLKTGMPILDTVDRLGYFDQSHLTNALRRFIGRTPTQIASMPVAG